MIRSALILGVVLVLTSACTPQRTYVSTEDTRHAMAILSPASLGRNLTVTQIVTGELLGEGKSVRFELVVDDDELVLVALTPTGVPLFSLHQTGSDIDVDKLVLDEASLSPEFLMADIKFSYWPIETLNLALGPFRSRVSEEEIAGVRHRVMRDEMGQVIVEVVYPPMGGGCDETVLRRFDVPYRLRIRSASSQEGSVL